MITGEHWMLCWLQALPPHSVLYLQNTRMELCGAETLVLSGFSLCPQPQELYLPFEILNEV